MITREVQLRVRYKDTDAMGIVHHANFITFYEVARTEMLREFGTTYRKLEESGIMLPVHEVQIKYSKAAFYDDLLTIKITLVEPPRAKMVFHHEIYNEEGTLINTGKVVLLYMNAETKRATRAPQWFYDLLVNNADKKP